MKELILASTSPRRHELLSSLNVKFRAVAPSFDESKFVLSADPKSVETLSLHKAKSVCKNLTVSALVIGADTVVICEDKILGKPKTRDEAYKMLKNLSGKTHHVITGIGIADTETGKEYTGHAVTYVTFNDLSDKQIFDYIDGKKPYDKAGAYGIQELPDGFVKNVDGETDNVIGLPTKILIKLLQTVSK